MCTSVFYFISLVKLCCKLKLFSLFYIINYNYTIYPFSFLPPSPPINPFLLSLNLFLLSMRIPTMILSFLPTMISTLSSV